MGAQWGRGIGSATLFFLAAMIGGCKSGARDQRPPPPGHADTEALLALAPTGTKVAVVASARSLGLLEDAVARLRAVGKHDRAIATAMGQLDRLLSASFKLAPGQGLDAMGLSRERGLAVFQLEDDGLVVIWPLGDRARFLTKMRGRAGTTTDTIRVDGQRLQCRETRLVYACADRIDTLDRLGTGSLAGRPALAGGRGDIEVVATSAASGQPPVEVAAVVSLEPGQALARARIRGLPADELELAGVPRALSPGRAAGFFALVLPAMLRELFDDDPTLQSLVGALGDTATIVVPSGVSDVDARLPLRSAAPFRELLAQCEQLPLPPSITIARDGDACVATGSFPFPFTATAWIEDDVLRVSRTRGEVAATTGPAPTALGRELGAEAWNLVTWGRGFGAPLIPPDAGAAANASRDAYAMGDALGARAYAYLTEVGFGIRAQGDSISVVAGVRTLFTNPTTLADAVTALVNRSMPAEDLERELAALARAHPDAPLAEDLAAGPGGLLVSIAGIGVVSALAIPPFLDYMNQSKRSPAEVNLQAIGKIAIRAHAEDGAFPVGATGPTPSAPCCDGPNRRCPPDMREWDRDPIWQALDFAVAAPSLYRYSYRSDGVTFTATASADTDCDGDEATFVLRGSVGPDGEPRIVLERPTRPD